MKHTRSFSKKKQALFEMLAQQERPDSSSISVITTRDKTKPAPLSFAQQRLWFLDQLEPGSSAYNISRVLRLTGYLNAAALEQSIGEIIRRHEVLRTAFITQNDRPFQRIAPSVTFTLPAVNLSTIPEEQRESRAQQLATEEERRPFDLTTGPLLRVILLQLKEEEHLLLVTMHHIITDGWSMSIFDRELSALYNAFSTGLPSPLPELSIQYADFAVWQRQYMQGEVLKQQMSYWRDQLGGELPVLELPTDRPRPAVQSFRGSTQQFILSGELTKGLRDLSQ
ncbi:MAG: condensation domain-containing protein, partial [Thermodesulfovibrionales bacterium]